MVDISASLHTSGLMELSGGQPVRFSTLAESFRMTSDCSLMLGAYAVHEGEHLLKKCGSALDPAATTPTQRAQQGSDPLSTETFSLADCRRPKHPLCGRDWVDQ